MAISAADVKKLREQTGAGMMDCKKALTETGGDFEKAVTLLREKGIAVAAKREARAASEGLIGSYISEDAKTAALVEINCETTFVAKTDEFIHLAKNLAAQVANEELGCLDCLLNAPYAANPGEAVRDAVSGLMGKIGEKLGIARFVRFSVGEKPGIIGSYIHMGDQIGVLAQLECESEGGAKSDDLISTAKDIAMHISWSNPDYMTHEDIPQDVLDKEREVHRQWAIKEGKPEKIIDRIVEGRMKDFYSKVCLLEQPFIKDEELTIQNLIDNVGKKLGEKVSIARSVRYRVGETAGESE